MTDNAQNSVVIERTLEASVELVWKLWTEPEHFAAWYGPQGASIPTAEMDVRVGGTRLLCMAMETPNGPMLMWFTGQYTEVVENQRLVYNDAMADADGNVMSPADAGMPEGHPEFTEVIVELEDLGGRTKMVMTHVGVPADSPGASGWNMAFDKLEAHIGSL
ncbi:MAG: hypothetical protein ACI9C1_000692 [Candidatus Aldehydirespiratoraceae bacterium]|jgi:uncharacterized protein YndB with AHSA1/START domain